MKYIKVLDTYPVLPQKSHQRIISIPMHTFNFREISFSGILYHHSQKHFYLHLFFGVHKLIVIILQTCMV